VSANVVVRNAPGGQMLCLAAWAGMSDKRRPGSSRPRWVLPAAIAVCAVALALSTNVAASLVPSAWLARHAAWVWAGTVVLGLISVWLAMLAARGATGEAEGSGKGVGVDAHASAEVVAAGAVLDRSVRGGAGSGHTIVAGPGAHVSIGPLTPELSRAQQPGQLIVGELPGARPRRS
jgi:hypothetical protein